MIRCSRSALWVAAHSAQRPCCLTLYRKMGNAEGSSLLYSWGFVSFSTPTLSRIVLIWTQPIRQQGCSKGGPCPSYNAHSENKSQLQVSSIGRLPKNPFGSRWGYKYMRSDTVMKCHILAVLWKAKALGREKKDMQTTKVIENWGLKKKSVPLWND